MPARLLLGESKAPLRLDGPRSTSAPACLKLLVAAELTSCPEERSGGTGSWWSFTRACLEGETITQTFRHPPSIPHQTGLGDLAAAAGKDHGRECCKPKSQGHIRGTERVIPHKQGKKKSHLNSHSVLKPSLCLVLVAVSPSAEGSGNRGD